MSNPNNHIGIFEELIRVLTIKKRTDFELMDKTLSSINLEHLPSAEKKAALIKDLEEYYNKIKPRNRFKRYLPILIITGLLVPLCILYFADNCNQVNKNTYQNSIIKEPEQNNKNSLTEIGTKNITERSQSNEKQELFKHVTAQNDNKTSSTDTIQNIIYITDTIRNNVVKTDTIIKNTDKKSNSPDYGYYCSLPKEYNFIFEKKSYRIEEKYQAEIADLSENIIHCKNLKNIEITGYCTRKLFFFSNKNIVSKRIDEIIKKLKKNHVSSKILRNSAIEFNYIESNINPESTELITINLNSE